MPRSQNENFVFVPTQYGLWELNLKSGISVRAPGIESSSSALYLHIVASDANAVWVEGVRAEDRILIRFEPKTQTWKTIPFSKKFPLDMRNMRYVSDGESCWIQTDSETFHLDTRTGGWEAVSASIGGKKSGETFQQILPDGDNVWLVPSNSKRPFYGYSPLDFFSHPPKFPLYRYRISTHAFSPEELPSEKPIRPHLLSKNSRSVMFATDDGGFRFDRISEEWTRIAFPKLPSGLKFGPLQSVFEDENYIVFGDNNKTLGVRK